MGIIIFRSQLDNITIKQKQQYVHFWAYNLLSLGHFIGFIGLGMNYCLWGGFQCNQKAAGYPHNSHNTIAPLGIPCLVYCCSMQGSSYVFPSCTASSGIIKESHYACILKCFSYIFFYQLERFRYIFKAFILIFIQGESLDSNCIVLQAHISFFFQNHLLKRCLFLQYMFSAYF